MEPADYEDPPDPALDVSAGPADASATGDTSVSSDEGAPVPDTAVSPEEISEASLPPLPGPGGDALAQCPT
ncbi:MAG: hypothetical protein VX938_07855, partial [Myxococcota bacterium]|nr:hypothetical protein [Myxococcota bacterium]